MIFGLFFNHVIKRADEHLVVQLIILCLKQLDRSLTVMKYPTTEIPANFEHLNSSKTKRKINSENP